MRFIGEIPVALISGCKDICGHKRIKICMRELDEYIFSSIAKNGIILDLILINILSYILRENMTNNKENILSLNRFVYKFHNDSNSPRL